MKSLQSTIDNWKSFWCRPKLDTIVKIRYENEKNTNTNVTNENEVGSKEKDIDTKNDPDDIGHKNLSQKSGNERVVNRKEKMVTCILIIYMGIQAFLPYSHFITKVRCLRFIYSLN